MQQQEHPKPDQQTNDRTAKTQITRQHCYRRAATITDRTENKTQASTTKFNKIKKKTNNQQNRTQLESCMHVAVVAAAAAISQVFGVLLTNDYALPPTQRRCASHGCYGRGNRGRRVARRLPQHQNKPVDHVFVVCCWFAVGTQAVV